MPQPGSYVQSKQMIFGVDKKLVPAPDSQQTISSQGQVNSYAHMVTGGTNQIESLQNTADKESNVLSAARAIENEKQSLK